MNILVCVKRVPQTGGRIVLTADGHVSEGSAENLFIVKDGVLITPPVTDNILEGITRGRLMEMARDDLGIEVNIRSIDRTELSRAYFDAVRGRLPAYRDWLTPVY